MQVILQEKIYKLGDLGDKVAVKAGYARNFLIPKGKVIPATGENLAAFETRRAELELLAKEALVAAEERAKALAALTVTMAVRSGEAGKLYGSIGVREVAEAITQAGVQVIKRELTLPEGPIRTLGEHPVQVQLHSDVVAEVTLQIVAE